MEIRFAQPEEIYELRRDVLRPGMGLESIVYAEDHDPEAFHLGVFEDGKNVCCLTFLKKNNADFPQFTVQYQMRGMCTHPDYRKRGYATALIQKGFELLQEKGAELVWFHARYYVLDFYRSFGCQDYGEFFVIPNSCEHKNMYKIF